MLVGLLMLPFALAQEGGVALGGSQGAPDYYEIQEGDTLWDISTRFLGDPHAWPELWSINDYITNPHWIYPGNRIYFRLGDNLNPPSGAAPDSPTEVAQDAGPSGPLCDFPPRFRNTRANARLFAPGTLGTPTNLNLQGTVYGSESGATQLGEDVYVYLQMKKPKEVSCGQVFAVFRELKKKVKGGRTVLGRMYRELGLVRVVRVDGNIVTAKIEQSFFEFERGDQVGDPIPVTFNLDVNSPDPAQDLQASIVARLTVEQQLANTGETIFLDRGTNDGLEAGTSLYVVERREGLQRLDQEDPKLPERVVGRVVVVRAEDRWSTAVVVDAATVVEVGDHLTTTPNPE